MDVVPARSAEVFRDRCRGGADHTRGEKLHIAQPALSQAIAQLESQLGFDFWSDARAG